MGRMEKGGQPGVRSFNLGLDLPCTKYIVFDLRPRRKSEKVTCYDGRIWLVLNESSAARGRIRALARKPSAANVIGRGG